MRPALIIALSFLLCQSAYSQSQLQRHFHTSKVQKTLLSNNAHTRSQIKKVEQFNAKFKRAGAFEKRTIPIIFHILYNNSKNKISEEQVLSQIEALNRDFSNEAEGIINKSIQKEGFDQLAVDTELEFCLADVSTIPGFTSPIHYVQTEVKQFTADQGPKLQAMGGTNVIAPGSYLNVWVCSMVDSVSGYAQMPGGPTRTDGIVIDYRFFGRMGTAQAPFDQGKTLTHLVGNYLNLYDIWGDRQCGDDYVADTPRHNAPNTGCHTYKHISLCQGNDIEMTMNFMDNTDDACMYMFTMGQKMRMHAVLQEGGFRAELVHGESHCKNSATPREEPLEEEITQKLSLNIFPNPASETFHIEIGTPETSNVFISINDALGKAMETYDLSMLEDRRLLYIDARDWPEGVYFIYAKDDESTVSKTVVIQN